MTLGQNSVMSLNLSAEYAKFVMRTDRVSCFRANSLPSFASRMDDTRAPFPHRSAHQHLLGWPRQTQGDWPSRRSRASFSDLRAELGETFLTEFASDDEGQQAACLRCSQISRCKCAFLLKCIYNKGNQVLQCSHRCPQPMPRGPALSP